MFSTASLNALVFDLEVVPAQDKQLARIIKLGALRPDTSHRLELNISRNNLTPALNQMDQLSDGAAWVLGHNIIDHDLPLLKLTAPTLALHRLKVIDTLRLSPLAFPRNPYHRLIKDYKLIKDSLNSPLADCDATLTLFEDQQAAFAQLGASDASELCCYQSLIAPVGSDLEALFREVTQRPPLARHQLKILIRDLLRETDKLYERDLKVCRTRLDKLLEQDLLDETMRWPLAYALAWLRVSGGNSVLAPWVRYQFPAVSRLIAELRDMPCGDVHCQYCSTTHDPRRELKRYFGFPDFRYEKTGESLQHDVVLAGMRGENVLAVLATGGGKSLCYQLPALNRYHRNGSLTVIISPLQSLMKDQVDGLLDRNVQCAASLNGLLTMPERADVLEKIQLGDVGILLVSPEQFRNKALRRAISQRQIGAWIFDEAHCLSKWGNDFRPDYLYASRFIKQFHADQPCAPIGCFTATAKPDVLDDIRAHFKEGLNIAFHEFLGSHERKNLSFSVLPCSRAEKPARVHQMLEHELDGLHGGAVVFVSSRKGAEDLSDFLVRQKWSCKHFHAGLPPGEKTDIQDDFKNGRLKVIVATNAFGMGVDKKDIRLVVHADIPGSLENYLQEAGRAGRDENQARCVLLYDPQDIETQFGLSERSKLSLRDIQQILRKLRFESSKRKGGELIITAGEILMDATVETSFAADDRDAETKVSTAVAWLERSQFLKREENLTRIFPARLGKSEQEAEQCLLQAQLPQRRLAEFRAILGFLYEAGTDERINTDQLMALTAQSHEEVAEILQKMEGLGLLINDTQLTLYVRHGIAGSSMQRLEQTLRLEKALLGLLPELAPDAGQEDWQDLNLVPLTAELRAATGQQELLPLHLLKLLRSLSQDHDGENQKRSSFELRQISRDHLKLRFCGNYTWSQIVRLGNKRRAIASRLMAFLIGKLPAGARSKDLLIDTTFGQLASVMEGDIELSHQIHPDQRRKAVEHALLYLHQQDVIILNHGMTVMRRAMTIEVNVEKKGSYLKEDYLRLDEHYREKCIQVHVMREYAEFGLLKMEQALRLVFDYFSQSKRDFIQSYFQGREEILKLATSEDSWKSIVHALSTSQKLVVADNDDQNRLVLAGPGSGKTRVIVHRIAYLLRVRRVPASSIIALTFNRHAANEIRKRLLTLVGADAYGVSVMTYHGMAMRLTGTRFERGEMVDEAKLKQVIDRAVTLLESGGQVEGEDDLCEQLLRGYRYIMVDEYQDIDEMQYRLVSALSGRNAEEDGRLCILAVGDDDQNIYDFRDTNNRYIERFCDEYGAGISYLVENYRSSSHIIAAANRVIGRNPARLKLDHPIRIDKARNELPAGGDWQARDVVRQGRVLRIQLPQSDCKVGNLQAQAVAQELQRLIALEDTPGWDGCAVLARNHTYLKPLQAWCELNGIPYFLAADKDTALPLMREREFVKVMDVLRVTRQSLRAINVLQLLTPYLADENWLAFFETAFLHLAVELGDCELSGQAMIDWLYDYARELRHQPRKGLYLGTVHSAKGLEFRHVGLLDSGWSDNVRRINDERRLYYVGMTRAEETLTLCEFVSGNPFSRQLGEFAMQQIFDGVHDMRLEKNYGQLPMNDIDLGYPGRKPHDAGIHAAIADLKPNDPLQLRREGDRFLIIDERGREVGRTAIAFKPGFHIEHCEVAGIYVRYMHDSDEQYRPFIKVDAWEVVIPRISGCSVPASSGASQT